MELYITKVQALKDEWIRMKVPVFKKTNPRNSKRKVKNSRITTTKLEEGKRTANEKFKMPILQALVDSGGRLVFSDLISKLEISMADQLNDFDRQPLPSSEKTIRWKNNVGWAKKPLRDAGYLSGTAPNGIWEITPAGRTVLERNRMGLALPENSHLLAKLSDDSIAQGQWELTPGDYDLAFHLRQKPRITVLIYEAIQGKILSLSEDIRESCKKKYVRYSKDGRTFVEIHVQVNQLKLWVWQSYSEIDDLQRLCRDVSHIGHYGNGPTEIVLSAFDQVDYVFELIKQSYKKVIPLIPERTI